MLTPGATYIYETVNGVTWAIDAETNERQIIGWDYAPFQDADQVEDSPTQQYIRLKEEQLWRDIRRVARSNKTLQNAMEECIIIYKLSKDYQDGI